MKLGCSWLKTWDLAVLRTLISTSQIRILLHGCLVSLILSSVVCTLHSGTRSELKLTEHDVHLILGIPWKGKPIVPATHQDQEVVTWKKYICNVFGNIHLSKSPCLPHQYFIQETRFPKCLAESWFSSWNLLALAIVTLSFILPPSQTISHSKNIGESNHLNLTKIIEKITKIYNIK